MVQTILQKNLHLYFICKIQVWIPPWWAIWPPNRAAMEGILVAGFNNARKYPMMYYFELTAENFIFLRYFEATEGAGDLSQVHDVQIPGDEKEFLIAVRATFIPKCHRITKQYFLCHQFHLSSFNDSKTILINIYRILMI